MKKHHVVLSMLASMLFLLCGCQSSGSKTSNLSIIYMVTAAISLLMLAFYCFACKKKDPWYSLLFACVLIVNIGYLALSISRNLDEALLANRLAYLGSVFLPLSMWMIIMNVTNTRYSRPFPAILLSIAVIVFLIAASPGYFDIYYKDVTFEKINGVTVLNKVYGPLHVTYLIYLLGCFAAMVITIARATLKKTIDSPNYAAIIAVAVFVNIGVWMIEQIVRIDFEILSISYIISEAFLLGLRLFMSDIEKQKQLMLTTIHTPPATTDDRMTPDPSVLNVSNTLEIEKQEAFLSGIDTLTPKERSIFECYVSGATTSEILHKLTITENTLKFHNKNLYGKLGVSSRKQLIETYKTINQKN